MREAALAVRAGLPANRLEQINMFTTTNRSFYDSWTTTLRGRFGSSTASLSYVLASSRSWGGQNVFDIFSKSSGTALDGTKLKDW